jgi:class 3 adenylate cyclase
LPRDIVNRINQGEKDISFVVPSATLMFIDIVKFSDYAVHLSPQEIMGNLSMIFCGYDAILPKYPLITKIKLIGDVYMCGGGLFKTDCEPVQHAEEMTRFALDCLQVLEEVNVKLDANLSVRIGINTGGPIIAGVLGTDKPVFDIIGDPINIAARLQSTSIPNRIQVSEETYELLKGGDIAIEPRGEIFLKGKGRRPTFIVSSANFAMDSSSDLFRPPDA